MHSYKPTCKYLEAPDPPLIPVGLLTLHTLVGLLYRTSDDPDVQVLQDWLLEHDIKWDVRSLSMFLGWEASFEAQGWLGYLGREKSPTPLIRWFLCRVADHLPEVPIV